MELGIALLIGVAVGGVIVLVAQWLNGRES
jgi:hypothetical protein